MKKFLLPLALFAATTFAFAADEKKSDTPDKACCEKADKACCEEKKASDKCDKPCCKQDGAEKKATEEKKA
ncbi:hypothetical protein [Opitutus terrae]|uniref:Uncharacterized protein n=1 Tax=Opitutus terrae (strain DSM 11246 / JCM 15787 / PB90-1) TaxID=452637 RepID=B1ZYN4_OPITP|nr:hypothetical protein [Opitutus terrae]ACB75270.1 hypothetical protein Oter_1987 [Opitutus terrae PB90-1]